MDCGETLPIEDELEVETYSQHELKSKKRNIVARVAIAGVVVVAAIGIAGLAINFHLNKSGNDKNVVQTWDYRNYNVMGGSGSWFLSRMERFDG
jgi:hypothetical protein